MAKRAWALCVVLALSVSALAVVACSSTSTDAGDPSPATEAVEPSRPAIDYVGTFSLEPKAGPIGTAVTVTGDGFDSNATFTLAWQEVHGQWNVDKTDGTFLGREFAEEFVPLAEVKADSSGAVSATFEVPNGFGFMHDVVLMQDGVIRNKSAFNIEMQASISPTSGPPGTQVTIDITGMGYQYLENSWQLTYDNRYNGWLSSVTTDGAASGLITASGQPGTHVLQVLHGWSHVPYLNMQQSPRPDRPTFTFEFTITDDPAVLPPPAEQQGLPIERRAAPANDGSPAIWTDFSSGPIGTPLVLRGFGLPEGSVEFAWYRVVGNRISGQGWEEESTVLGTVVTASDGTVEFHFDALDDLGGPHRIEAIAGGAVVATTDFDVKPSAFAVENVSAPVGSIARFHLKGVGWTETANIYTVVYDNAFMGFACGFNTQGDIEVFLPLTGEPGWHFVDFYPAIYRGEDLRGSKNFRLPQLTYADDHPGEELPRFRFAVEVTGSGVEAARR